MRNWKNLLIIIILFGCRKPYNPPVTTSPTSYLIVEGFISTNDSTKIKLSRTVNLSSTITTNPVTGSSVVVLDDAGGSYPLNEYSPGNYAANTILSNTSKYQVRITTTDNQVYLSDLVPVKITPPVDSIGFVVQNNGIQIYANSHDPQNSTRYYRFDYDETWRFHAHYNSGYIAENGAISIRNDAQSIYYCFTGDKSSTIVLGSTAKLTQDVLYQTPITTIASNAEKLETRYSILLREYAMTADAFTFWTSLKKNTEQLGSIFDAQPSQISGNIHNTGNAKEIVVGYISAGTIQSKRIFIDNSQLPTTWSPDDPYNCELDSLWIVNPKTGANQVQQILLAVPPIELPVYSFFKGGPGPAGYLSATEECVDCTLRGTKTQPAFWK
jgi:hypothetical protein